MNDDAMERLCKYFIDKIDEALKTEIIRREVQELLSERRRKEENRYAER